MRRIGVLMSAVEGDQRGLESITAFAQGLAELGWTIGRNVRNCYASGLADRVSPNELRSRLRSEFGASGRKHY
jgi:hypothetical protein